MLGLKHKMEWNCKLLWINQEKILIYEALNKHAQCSSISDFSLRLWSITSSSSTFVIGIFSPTINPGKFLSVTANHGIMDVNPLFRTWYPTQWKHSPPTPNSTFILQQEQKWYVYDTREIISKECHPLP